MYVTVGLGMLAKGPVAAALPAVVFFAYLACHRELARVREMMIPTGALIVLAVVAPWYVQLYAQHGWTYISEFFIGENLGRFMETVGVQRRGPAFYLPIVFTDALPWSLALPAVVAAWWRERTRADAHHRIRTLLLLWVGVIVLLFSFSQTKQDLYIFPIVAAVAALGGDWIARMLDVGPAAPAQSGRGWLTTTLVVLGLVLAGVGALVLYLFGEWQTVYRVAGAQVTGWLALAGGAAIVVLAWRHLRGWAVATALTIFIAVNWILALVALPSFEQYKPVVPLSREIARRAMPSDVVAHFDVALPSMVFYLQRHIDIWLDADRFIQQMRSDRVVYAVLSADRYAELDDRFGVPTCVLARHATSDVRLRSLLELVPPPEVVLVTNRCPPA
jgi:4-amino-4-deoxy-L-arabinose transferase-like glycosyltransferase